MDERRCPACGASEQPGANFCPQCGVAAGARYVDPGDAPADTSEVVEVGHSAVAKVLVPLGVVAVLGLLVIALLGAGGSNGDEPEEAQRADPAAPQPLASATPTPVPTAAPGPTPLAMPTATPIVAIESADPDDLPDTDATHLAVAYKTTVHFLDLRTGTWTQTDVGRRIRLEGAGLPGASGGLNAFGAGVVLDTDSSGGPNVVPLNGDEVSLLGGLDSGLLAVRNEVAFVQSFSADKQTVLAFTPEGELLYEASFVNRMRVVGVTADGRVAVQAGANVMSVGPDGTQSLGAGIFSGVVANKVLLFDCSTLADCRTELVDATTGERSDVSVDGIFFESLANGDLLSYSARGEPTVYRLIDDELVEVPGPAESAPGRAVGLGLATDSAGVSARVVINQIEFIDDAGTVLSSIPFAPNRCCSPPFGITFIYTDS